MNDQNANPIFTVGHSNLGIERFIGLLFENKISVVADVRSMPYSKFAPQFNREVLIAALGRAGIKHLFLGGELGARRSEPECYVGGKAVYELIARTRRFQDGLRVLVERVRRDRIALLCAEKDPVTCHRAILVCRHLRPFNLTISHILEDGRTESQAEMEESLLKITGVEGEDLFTGRSESIERAYDIQGDRIAYSSNGAGPTARRRNLSTKIFTIGFTKKSAERFFTMLQNAGVKRVVDVRLNNISQLAGFTKMDDLRYFLKAIGNIGYVHLPALAPTQEMLDAYKKQKGDWSDYEKQFLKLMADRHIEDAVSRDTLNEGCLLCSEDTPEHCHRRLVAEYLAKHWPDVQTEHLL